MTQAYLKTELKLRNWGSWVYVVCFQGGCSDALPKMGFIQRWGTSLEGGMGEAGIALPVLYLSL